MLKGGTNGKRLSAKLTYLSRCLPAYAWRRLGTDKPTCPVHLILALADHFEPAILPGDGRARAPYPEQERRLERWCDLYPKLADRWRDSAGRPFVHTYFYPAEQYDGGLVDRLAEHCHTGWGEIEVHLHHGSEIPDSAENTRRQLEQFRDLLVRKHGALSYWEGSGLPRYAFVHGNFALANSAAGRNCGVDGEMQVLSETGCYADMTLPAAVFDPAQVAKINSIYECGLPLHERAPHRRGRDLEKGRPPREFPIVVQGPLVPYFTGAGFHARMKIENAAITGRNPLSVQRLQLWKRAAVSVKGRPEWLFIKLHCHGMDPMQDEAVLGEPMRQFLQELTAGAPERGETLHFVTARELVNIALAACDGREGNPGEYRDYRLQKKPAVSSSSASGNVAQVSVKG
jgi:hypothetical protein